MQNEREKFLLFRVWKHKDANAYGELYNNYAPKIYRYLSFKLPTKKDAEELTSDVFLRAWEYLQNTTIETFSAFLFRIARNAAADFYRQRKHEEVSIDSILEPESKEAPEDEVHDKKLAIRNLRQHLNRLKEEYRDVIIMRYLEEMSYKEIAIALDKTENTTRVLLHRAMNALKKQLDS